VTLPAAPARVFSFPLFVADDAIIVNETIPGVRIARLGLRILEEKKQGRSNGRAQGTHTAHQQRKYVEQASASSGNQCVLGHRSVPRFELFAPDDSTNGDRAMFGVLARLASASIPVSEQEKQHAIRS